MRSLRAFLFGAFAVAIVGWAGLTALAVALQSAGSGVHAELGPLLFLSVSRGTDGTETTFGTGLACIAILGGVVNALAAGYLSRRARDDPPIA